MLLQLDRPFLGLHHLSENKKVLFEAWEIALIPLQLAVGVNPTAAGLLPFVGLESVSLKKSRGSHLPPSMRFSSSQSQKDNQTVHTLQSKMNPSAIFILGLALVLASGKATNMLILLPWKDD